MSRIPEDAFGFYFALGAERTYEAVASKYGVSRQAVAKYAANEGWQKRIEEIERRSREGVDKKIAETVEDMNLRHLKMLKIVQGKALEALKESRLTTAMEAVRALDIAIKGERLVRGEPTERAELGVAEIVERESKRWLKVIEGEGGSADGDRPDEPQQAEEMPGG